MLKINCNGKRTVGKANKGIHVGKNNRFKKLKIKIIKKKKKKEKRKKEKFHRTAKVQRRGRSL